MYYLQSKDELAAVLLRGTTGKWKLRPKTADFRWYDQFSDFVYTEAGEQYKATKFGIVKYTIYYVIMILEESKSINHISLSNWI